jgi:YVTN family beta-propeller protein
MMVIGVIPSGNYGYAASTKTFTISGAAFQGLTIESILLIYNLTKKRPVYNSKNNTVNDITDFTIGSNTITFKINAPYAGEFANTDKFQIIVCDTLEMASYATITKELEFSGTPLNEELFISNILLNSKNFSKYLVTVSKPELAAAGDLTLNLYNHIQIDPTNYVDALLSTNAIANTGATVNKSLQIEGLSSIIKVGMKFGSNVSAAVTVGAKPFGVAVNSAGTKVYVVNYGAGTVSVIDTSSNTVSATVTVGANPYGVAVNPAGTKVYVANSGAGTVSVIDTSSNTVSATVTVGANPRAVAVNPAGTKVYVANNGAETVSVIDTSSNTVSATVTVGANPYGVAVNPAGTKVYVANNGAGTVSVIDTSSNTVSAPVTVGANPFGVAVNPAGTKVYVTNYGAGTVSVIDTSSNTVSAPVTVGANPFGVAVNPAGTKVYVTNNGAGTVSVIDTSSNTVSATVTVGANPLGVAVNPAGTKVYVTNYGAGTVSVKAIIAVKIAFDKLN